MKKIIIILFCLAPAMTWAQDQQQINLHLDKSQAAIENMMPAYGAAIGLACTGIVYQNILDPSSDLVNNNFYQVGNVMLTGSIILGSIAISRLTKSLWHQRKAHRIRKGKARIK